MFDRLIDAYLGRNQPSDPMVWHKWNTFRRVRLTNGKWSEEFGQLWRRLSQTGWEYQQDADTHGTWMDLNSAP